MADIHGRCIMSLPPNSIRSFVSVGIGSVALLLLSPTSAKAGDWYVDVNFAGCASGSGSAASPFCHIMDAVSVASDGDVIHIAAGTYAEHLLIGKNLTLHGTDGRDVTIVDATKSGR